MTYRDLIAEKAARLMAEKANRPPNWNKWRLMPKARLWQCVALSMNIDPDKVNTDDVSWRGVRTLFNGESQEFRDRQDMACANAGEDGALRPADYGESPDFYSVSLREFAAWVPIGWESPPELLAMASEHDPAEENTPTSAARRVHNKRDTEARNLSWQAQIDDLATKHQGTSHTELCRKLGRKVGVDFQTIRRNTRRS